MNFNLFSNIINNFKFLSDDFNGISLNALGAFMFFVYLFFAMGAAFIIFLLGDKIRLFLFKEHNDELAPFINIGLGYIFFTTGIAILGVFSLLNTWAIAIYLFVAIFIGAYPVYDIRKYIKKIIKLFEKIYLEYKFNKWIFIAIFIFVFIAFLRLIPPETGEDAISHHTSLPSLYLKTSSIMVDPKLSSSIVLPVPQLGEMLYVVTQSFGIKDSSRYVHFVFYFLFLALIYYVGKNKKNGSYSALLLITAPVVIQVSSKANTDFQWLLCWLLSIILITNTKMLKKSVMLSALIFGGVLATKLWTIVFLPIFIIYIVLVAKNNLFGIKMSAVFLLFALSVPLLWYVRSYMLTGSPFYPVFSQVLPNPLGPSFSSYIGFNKLIFHYENLLKFSPIFFLSIVFFFFNKLNDIAKIIHSRLFIFFVLLSIEYLFMHPYFYPRYLLGLYVIFIIIISFGIKEIVERAVINKIIVVTIYLLLMFYYGINTLITLPYGFGWADNNKYLTRVLSLDNSSYYNFDNLFNKFIDKNDLIVTYGIFGYYYADFSYVDAGYIFNSKNKSFNNLKASRVTKLLIKGGDIEWFCKELGIYDCNKDIRLLASFPKEVGKYYFYSL